MNDYDTKKCYLCGGDNSDTYDHIPPKNIFLEKYRNIGQDLISVPAHKSCNKQYEKDDEFFRYFILTSALWHSPIAKELWDKKIGKPIHRRQSAGFLNYIRKNIFKVDIYSKGGIYLGKRDVAFIDAKRTNLVLERIARGIYYKLHRNILQLEWPIDIQMLEMNEGLKQVNRLNIESQLVSIGNNTFKYESVIYFV